MLKFSKKQLVLTLFTLILVWGLFGCAKKPETQVNLNENKNTNTDPVDAPNTYWEIDNENWKTFINEKYGYQIDIPPGWEVNISQREYSYVYINKKGQEAQFPFLITIEDNSDRHSSKEFVHWGKGYYDKEFEVIIGDSYRAYEFYNVWAGDQGEEVIFLTKDNIAIQFSFPIAKENLNLDNPIENNKLVHQALKTFRFIEE